MDIKLPLRIFSVDPATTKSGWSVLELISINPLKIKVLKHGQIDGQKLLTRNKEMTKIFQKQFCVLDALEQEYVSLIEEYQPDIVVSESAFGYTHMSALIALTLAIDTLRRASKRVRGKDITLVAPTLSKKAATGSGVADKLKMREAYLNTTYLEKIGTELSEHEIDAIFHGIAYVKIYITHELVVNKK